MTSKELVKILNDLNIIQKSIDWIEDLPETIYEKYFETSRLIKGGIDPDKHRWYETTMEVHDVIDIGLIGVVSITDLVSENSSVSDIFYTLKFYEVEEVKVTTYKIK